MESLRFNRNPSHWPAFIQYFKERVHMKRTFSDSLRRERLLSVPDDDAKRVVSAIGRNGLFYATALKALKGKFGNPYSFFFVEIKSSRRSKSNTKRQSKRSQAVSSTTINSRYVVNINGVFLFY